MPGSTPATSQLDWLSSTTAITVLFWSRATRDLLKSFGWGIAALHSLDAATKLPFPRRPPHNISKPQRDRSPDFACGGCRQSRKPRAAALRYWNLARQRHYPASARCCRILRVSADAAAPHGRQNGGKPASFLGERRKSGKRQTVRWRG